MLVGDVIIWRNDPDYLGILLEITEEHMVIKPLTPRFIEELLGFNVKGDWKLKRSKITNDWRKLCKNSK